MEKLTGYHLSEIEKGIYGKSSKIKEEIQELIDAEKQNNPIMILNELSDIVGAIKGYLANNFKEISFEDVIKMADATERAFASGRRKCE